MFARKFSSDGRMRCPTPWRARNATRRPRSVPMTYRPDGSPNGVVIVCSSRSVSSAMSYRPLPPMMPIEGLVIFYLRRGPTPPVARIASRHEAGAHVLRRNVLWRFDLEAERVAIEGERRLQILHRDADVIEDNLHIIHV